MAHALEQTRPFPPASGYDKLPFLEALPPRVRAATLDRAVTRRLKRGQAAFWQGEKIRLLPVVLEGHAKLIRNTAGGREVVIDFAGPGTPICWPEILGDAPLTLSFVAVEDCIISFLPIAPVRHCVSSDVRSSLAYAELVTTAHREMLQQLSATRAASVPARLGGLLMFLLERRGDMTTGWIPIRLSRQDLADAAGTTVETVIRLMRKWEKAGVLETHRAGVRILDQMVLTGAADGESH
ncbi:MAG: Crp/Fnr family transcriptional regulator [Deltaproteobacteria bacterium]|nr:Crp/Fnr family transcriptional regulator [Deltaproteobacteria bacterium]